MQAYLQDHKPLKKNGQQNTSIQGIQAAPGIMMFGLSWRMHHTRWTDPTSYEWIWMDMNFTSITGILNR